MDTPRPTICLTTLVDDPGKPLLLVGPSMGTTVSRLWGGAVHGLGHHVVGWELPGHGDAPTITEPLTLGDLADAVLAALDNTGFTGPFAYAGDSIGGAVGLLLALAHPDRIRTVATVCSSPRFGEPQAWLDRAALVRREGLAPVVETTPSRWFGSLITTHPAGRIEAALADLAAVDPESYARLCEALADLDLWDSLERVATPVLAIAGSDDPVSPPSVMKLLSNTVPNGRLAVLNGVGHLAPLEDPARVAQHLRAHLDRR